ncbi:hypothetical protein [Glaesserella sp.]|uniref:vWA domain-containing protein n=1 Tax=Glaesserella sp. TaxID=2094731 RepID=UPI00359F9A8E
MWSIKKLFVFCLLAVSLPALSKSQEPVKPMSGDTEVIFILDRSGSMSGLESDTIGGFNGMLEKQKKEHQNEAYITTVLFDDRYELLHNRIPVSEIKAMTDKEYFVRGSTALLDAVGKTITQVKNNQAKLGKEKADKVVFIIITDGMENASREFSLAEVKRLIETQKEKENWEFLFLGANIDAVSVAGSFGIDSSKAVKYKSDSRGTQKNYEVLNQAIQDVRAGKALDSHWKKEIEQDLEQRENK